MKIRRNEQGYFEIVVDIVTIEGAPTEDWLAAFEGKTFQFHAITGRRIKLSELTIPPPETRCPVVIMGERCGEKAGHEGKHCWAGGD